MCHQGLKFFSLVISVKFVWVDWNVFQPLALREFATFFSVVYPSAIFILISRFRYFAPEYLCLPRIRLLVSLPPFFFWSNFLSFSGMSCFVCITWSRLSIILVFLFLLGSSDSSLRVLFSSSQHILVFYFCRNISYLRFQSNFPSGFWPSARVIQRSPDLFTD